MAKKRYHSKGMSQHNDAASDKKKCADYLPDVSKLNKASPYKMKTKVSQIKNVCLKDNQPNPTIKTITDGIKETSYYHNEAKLFPKNLHWLLFIVTMVFRLWYVSMPTNWWILHPDEIYQTIEGTWYLF